MRVLTFTRIRFLPWEILPGTGVCLPCLGGHPVSLPRWPAAPKVSFGSGLSAGLFLAFLSARLPLLHFPVCLPYVLVCPSLLKMAFPPCFVSVLVWPTVPDLVSQHSTNMFIQLLQTSWHCRSNLLLDTQSEILDGHIIEPSQHTSKSTYRHVMRHNTSTCRNANMSACKHANMTTCKLSTLHSLASVSPACVDECRKNFGRPCLSTWLAHCPKKTVSQPPHLPPSLSPSLSGLSCLGQRNYSEGPIFGEKSLTRVHCSKVPSVRVSHFQQFQGIEVPGPALQKLQYFKKNPRFWGLQVSRFQCSGFWVRFGSRTAHQSKNQRLKRYWAVTKKCRSLFKLEMRRFVMPGIGFTSVVSSCCLPRNSVTKIASLSNAVLGNASFAWLILDKFFAPSAMKGVCKGGLKTLSTSTCYSWFAVQNLLIFLFLAVLIWLLLFFSLICFVRLFDFLSSIDFFAQHVHCRLQ